MEAPMEAPAVAPAGSPALAPAVAPAVAAPVVAPVSAPVEAAVVPAAVKPVVLTAAERKEATRLAELYSIFSAVEHLEGAFVRGAVPNEEYERHCQQLIAQFKTLQTAVRSQCPDIRAWLAEEGLTCPLAEERLLGS